MFTITDFEKVRSGKGSRGLLDAILFSVQKNEFAYAMNLCNSHDRGHYTEKMLQNRLIEQGFDVIHCGEGGDYDLLIALSFVESTRAGIRSMPASFAALRRLSPAMTLYRSPS